MEKKKAGYIISVSVLLLRCCWYWIGERMFGNGGGSLSQVPRYVCMACLPPGGRHTPLYLDRLGDMVMGE